MVSTLTSIGQVPDLLEGSKSSGFPGPSFGAFTPFACLAFLPDTWDMTPQLFESEAPSVPSAYNPTGFRSFSFDHPVLWYAPESERLACIREAWQNLFPNDPFMDFNSASEVLQFLWNPVALKPRVVVLDLSVSETSGLHILQAIRANPALHHLPVAVITPVSKLSSWEAGYNLGADWCFSGPEDPEQATFFVEAAFQHFQRGRLARSRPALVPELA